MTTPAPDPAPATTAPAAASAGDAAPTGPVGATTANATAPAAAEAPTPPTEVTAVEEGEDNYERVLGPGAKGDPENPAIKTVVDEKTGEPLYDIPLDNDAAVAVAADDNQEEKANG